MKKTDVKRTVRNVALSLAIPVGMFLIFALLSGGQTFTVRMFTTTLRQSVMPIIICWGLMLNMSVGMMNFSAGAMMLTAGIIGGNLAKSTGTGVLGFALFTLVIAVAVGAITGLLYNWMRVPAIVLTIGTMLVWEAFPKMLYTGGVNLRANMTVLSREPYIYIILGFMLVIFHLLFNYTEFGHNLRAIGNNQAIANSVGLNSDRIKFLAFLYGSVFIGVAAVLYVSQQGEVRNVSAMGSMTIMMDGFMGLFISMFLAKYCNMSVAVILGTFTMKMLSNGFVAMGLPATVRDIVQGIFLLILLVISANAGLFERRRADKLFAESANKEYQAAGTAGS